MARFEAAGFDEFESGLWPAKSLCGLFATESSLAADGAEGLAEFAAGGDGGGRQGGAEGAACVGGVAVAADCVGEDGGVGAAVTGLAGTEAGRGPGGEAEDAFAGSGFGGLADQAFAGWPGDGVGDFDLAGIEVDLLPLDGEWASPRNVETSPLR